MRLGDDRLQMELDESSALDIGALLVDGVEIAPGNAGSCTAIKTNSTLPVGKVAAAAPRVSEIVSVRSASKLASSS